VFGNNELRFRISDNRHKLKKKVTTTMMVPSSFKIATVALLLLPGVAGFFISNPQKQQQATTILCATTKATEATAFFESPAWLPIRQELDQVPLFTCANGQGQPLAYQLEIAKEGGETKTMTVPFFYTDVEDALRELETAKQEHVHLEEGLDIIPIGLGGAFHMWSLDQAVIVPNKNAILQAGAPPNANPIGQEIPLFVCMDVSQTNEQGRPVLPLFMTLEEANAAVMEAAEAEGGDPGELEVTSLGLSRAVELLAKTIGDDTAPTFHFIPPASSIRHIQGYLAN
jgi:hypothetical protein